MPESHDPADGAASASPDARPGTPRPVPASAELKAGRIGRIVSLSGARLVVLLDTASGENGVLQMGALVKVVSAQTATFGLIEALSIPMPREQTGQPELRVAEVSLLGEIWRDGPRAGRFHRGVSRQPSLDDEVFTCDQTDAATVYALPNRQAVSIGTVHQAPDVPAKISVNDMLGKHFAILGTTGTGKSCGLTVILRGMLEKMPAAHILLLDPHGEYGQAFGDRAEHLTGETLRLPYWIFNFEEFVEVVFGAEKQDHATEANLLRDLITTAKVGFAKDQRLAAQINVDTPVPYAMGELGRLLDEAMGKMDNRANLGPYLTLRARLGALQSDRRYNFMFHTGIALRDNLAALIGKLFRVPAEGRPMSIVDLTGIPSEVLSVVVAVISRMAFDFALWGGHKAPLLLVCEEAHRYAPSGNTSVFEPAKRNMARIAKEGRKYGISLGVLSQRPSDLEPSILSQCNTVIAFRMTNERDQEIIKATLSDAASPLMTSLPLLANGEALAVGEGVAVPLRMHMTVLAPSERPRSGSAVFTERWQDAAVSASLTDDIVEIWRGQKAPDAI